VVTDSVVVVVVVVWASTFILVRKNKKIISAPLLNMLAMQE